jgi:hypothetical protein
MLCEQRARVSIRATGSAIVTTTDGHANPIVWIVGTIGFMGFAVTPASQFSLAKR